MTTSADSEEKRTAACIEVQGKKQGLTGHKTRDKRQEGRMVRKSVVAKVVARGARVMQYNTTTWQMVRKETREAKEREEDMATQSVRGDTTTAFMGRKEIVFPKEIEKPRLVQRRGADRAPSKHWTQEQAEDQEEHDLVLHSRAPDTWVSYTRWWQLFVNFVKMKGVSTSDWKSNSAGDRIVMVMMLRKLTVSMMQTYAYGAINMLVTAVTRAAKDFGWASPREDERFAAVMEGLRRIKGVCATIAKKLAMIAEHVRAIM